jgi:hypothetical protein
MQQQIEKLEARLVRLLGKKGNGSSATRLSVPRNMSAEGKARIAAAQKRRWAAWRKKNPQLA